MLSAERLEVSVDGLTLSPDPEERPGVEGGPLLPPPTPLPPPPPAGAGAGLGPGAAGEAREPGEAAAGGAAEEARRLEQRWGFGLEELYGLALRFFKGEPPGQTAATQERGVGGAGMCPSLRGLELEPGLPGLPRACCLLACLLARAARVSFPKPGLLAKAGAL